MYMYRINRAIKKEGVGLSGVIISNNKYIYYIERKKKARREA